MLERSLVMEGAYFIPLFNFTPILITAFGCAIIMINNNKKRAICDGEKRNGKLND